MKAITKLFIALDVLIILLALGLYLPFTSEKIKGLLADHPAIEKVIYGGNTGSSGGNRQNAGLINQEDVGSVLVADSDETRITMIMTGDALIHSTVYNTHKTANGYDFTDIFTYVKPIVQQYDLAYYNQETILGGTELGLSNYPQFNSPQEVGDAFVDAGFNLVSLCNNHTLDGRYRYGDKALINSRNYWNNWYEKEGIIATGSWTSWEEREQIVIGEMKGITYAMLSYTTVDNMLYPPKGKEYLTNFYSEKQVKKDVEAYRDKVDLLIVAMHWGVDYILTPNASEKQIAKYLSSLGVDIVIGNHGHYLQPIDMVGDTLVFYGLGNFVSAQNEDHRPYSLTGCLASVDIIKSEKDGKVKISFENVKAQLVYTVRSQKFKVIPYSKLSSRNSHNNATVFEKMKKVLTEFWDEVEVIE
ncbi:MAG: CapA family protein [Erysipelotrichaceae bacterium]|nr:CapA family protein [Erysipelotrichaceae bacterium]